MRDPFFERTVVLLWHHDEEGAIGVVVNRPVDHALREVVILEEDVADCAGSRSSQVVWGGPVESDAGTVVTRGTVSPEEGWQLDCGIGVTRSQEALTRLLKEEAPIMLCLGYAGWGPGQLDREIESGGWLWTDIDPDLVFEQPAASRYDMALASLGLTASTAWMQVIEE